MRYHILATDYDGTLTHTAHLESTVVEAIRRLRDSGRKAILVTGRELEVLKQICPQLDLFASVVAENGALIYRPATKEVRLLAEAPPPAFAERLKALGVKSLSVGHVIVATVKPHETAVLNTINEMGLELQVIFNQDAVMVLPSGVNKATGLLAALKELGYSPHNVVAVGDAENDHALLATAELGVAVGNAVPALRERADYVARGGAGTAVVELVDLLAADDMKQAGSRMTRHDLTLGVNANGKLECLPAYGKSLLITGQSGSGKSVVAAAIMERMEAARYQYAIVDPEGDYTAPPGAVVLGSAERPPVAEEVENLLKSGRNVVINLLGIPVDDRCAFFSRLLPRLLDLRDRTGRPHWLFVDEAHNLLPKSWTPATDAFPRRFQSAVLITVHPASVSPAALKEIDLVLALGDKAQEHLGEFAAARGVPASPAGRVPRPGEALAWWVGSERPAFTLSTGLPEAERRKHKKKFAEGRLPDEQSFVFRGPRGKLHLRAYNLVTFLELAEGVDDATWLHHLKGHDYSRWLREHVQDAELARQVEAIEKGHLKDVPGGRAAVRKVVEAWYSPPGAESVKS
jgi:HAD superfamily hydrolase (TIGR01484 family)